MENHKAVVNPPDSVSKIGYMIPCMGLSRWYKNFFVKEEIIMANNYNTLRAGFKVTVDGCIVSIYLKQNGALLIRSQIINHADISFLEAYVVDLEKAIMKYTKAVANSMNNGNKQQK